MSEVIEAAIKLHRAGDLEAAATNYQAVLTSDPNDADAHHFYGMLLYQVGQHKEGMQSVEKALELLPEYASACNNLANMKLKAYQVDEAEKLYLRSIELNPGLAEPLLNLGAIARSKRNFTLAEELFENAIKLEPDNSIALMSLSNLYSKLKHYDVSLAVLKRCLELNLEQEEEISVLQKMGRLCQILDQKDETLAVYRHWIEKYPDDVSAAHMLAAASGENVPKKADNKYVKDLFDRFAGSFDEVLDVLEYKAPEYINELVDRHYEGVEKKLSIVDAGCGTGLCGHFLKPVATQLVGVDISPGMLERAKFREEYDELVEADLTEYFNKSSEQYDLIVSADTLCYFGDLVAFFKASATSMHTASRLLFTVECLDEESSDGYRLESHGRYSHQREYIEESLSASGFSIETMEEKDLRLERAQKVKGFLVGAKLVGAQI